MTPEEISERSVKCLEGLMEAFTEKAMGKLDQLVEKIERSFKKIELKEAGQKWLTVKEAAEMLGKSEYTIREYVKSGKLDARRDSSGAGGKGEWRISYEAIARFREPNGQGRPEADSGFLTKLNPARKPEDGGLGR